MGLKTWLKERHEKDMIRRNPGLAEKEAATQAKLDVALKIIGERRKEEKVVEVNRRKPEEYNGHLKPA